MGSNDVEILEGKGIKAIVKDTKNLYASIKGLATRAGYKDAVGVVSEKVEKLEERLGEKFSVLAKGEHPWGTDDLYIIQSRDGERFVVGGRSLTLFESKDINLEDMGYGELMKHAENAIKHLRYKAYEEGYKQGRFDAKIEPLADEFENTDESSTMSQQQKREYIIEQAKKDVELIKREHVGVGELIGYEVKFVVNKDKRTVVALIRFSANGYVYRVGIAKAHPNDCFNVHIGKIIALSRALNMEVEKGYLNAPQPEEVQVGDIVDVQAHSIKSFILKREPFRVEKIVTTTINEVRRVNAFDSNGYYAELSNCRVIDDSKYELQDGDD